MPNPNSLFIDNNSYSDEEIAQGFLLYNKHWRKIEIDYSKFAKVKLEKKKKSFLDLFKLRG